jgi:hypothetical protein
MYLRVIFLFILIANSSTVAYSSFIKGTIVNESGEPLPFATIYVKNTTYGVTSNSDGEYYIELKPGSHVIIFSYVGHISKELPIQLTEKGRTINITLLESATSLNELEIVSNTKNKAKEVMAKARKKRKLYLNAIENYSCNTYMKNSLEKRQIKFTKKELENAEEILITDTSIHVNFENEILNFIESYSITNYEATNKYKEEFLGYHDFADTKKESGLDVSATVGYGEYSIVPTEFGVEDPYLLYTEVSTGDFNLYKSSVVINNVLEKPIISPLSINGALYYRFDFKGSFYEENSKIYKIKVTPLFNGEPLFKGILFIEDSTFSIKSFELSINGPMLLCKNFNLIQDYIQIDTNMYLPARREINYTIKEGKYQIIGNARISHKNYKINKVFPKKFFNTEERTFNDSVYSRDSTYWNHIRPITLKEKEIEYIDYTDSLRDVHQSEKYLLEQDSIANRVTLGKIIFAGFFHRNRFKGNEFYIEPVVSQFNFFGIGGYRHRLGMHFNKAFENDYLLETDGEIDYGFRNKDVKGKIGVGLTYFPKKFVRTFVRFGDYYELINEFASLTSAFTRSNYARTKSVEISQRMEIFNGLYGEIKFDYANKIAITDLQLADWINEIFVDTLNTPTNFQDYIKSEFRFQFTYIPKQRFYYKNNKKIVLGSDYPTFNLIYRKGIPGLFNSEVNFDYIEIGAFDEIKLPQLGSSKWNVQAGTFLNKNNLRVLEWKYFRGSDYFFFSNPLKSFQLLGPTLSTPNEYIRGNYMHHFEGAILNKIPIIHRLKLSLAGGAGFLLIPEDGMAHGEVFAGIERITRIREQLFRIGIYAVTADNTLDNSNSSFNPNFTFKFGVSYYNPVNRKWDF